MSINKIRFFLNIAKLTDQIALASYQPHNWLPEEESLLQRLFVKNISMDEVRDITKDQPMLDGIKVAKIRDEVRAFF